MNRKAIQLFSRSALRSSNIRSVAGAARSFSPAVTVPVTGNTVTFQSKRLFSTKDSNDDDMFFSGYEEDGMVQYPAAETKIGQIAPTFTAPAVVDGEIVDLALEDYRGKWTVLLFYPKDFTFVCPTELTAFSDRHSEFEALNAQVIAISTDTEECHLAWTRTPRTSGGLGKMNIPIVADKTKTIASRYGTLEETNGICFRGLFIINSDGGLEQMTINNFDVGRSVDETLRLIQAFQFAEEHGQVCPANWKPGDDTITANPEDSQEYFAKLNEPSQESDKIRSVKSVQEFEKAIGSGKVVVDFMASWCGKCKQIEPHVEKLAEEYSDVTFVKVDTAHPDFEALKEKYEVDSLPAFNFFKDGKRVGKPVVGYKKRLLSNSVAEL